MSPTARSLEFARKQGWEVDVVERFNAYARKRKDLLGCIDLVVVTDGGVIGVQACAATDHARRAAKAAAEPRLGRWLRAGARFEVWSWGKRGARGRAKRWILRRQELVVSDVVDPALSVLG